MYKRNAFYNGETHRSLSDHINGPRFTTRCRTQTYQLLSTLNSTRSLSKNAGLSVSYTNYQTPPQTTSAPNLKLYTNLPSNPDTPPVSTSVNPPKFHPRPSGIKQFRFSLLYSTAEEGHCDLAESLHFHFVSSLNVLPTLTRGPDDAFAYLR